MEELTNINENVFVPTAEGAQKFVDFKGLDYFWSKAKAYVDNADDEVREYVDNNLEYTYNEEIAPLKAVVGDTNSGLVQAVNQLRSDVDALGGEEGGIQGMIDASIEALDLDTKFETADTNAEGYANAAKEAAIGHADGLNTAMNTRVEELESKKHEHANKAELDLVKSGDVAKWDETTSRVNTFLDGEGVAETVDTLKDIQAWINGDGVNATELTEAIAAEAKLRGDADAAINAKIGTVAEDTTVVDMIAAAEEAAITQANAATTEALKSYYTKTEVDGLLESNSSADQAYAKKYTDELFASMTFATEADIDKLFYVPRPA